MSEQLMIIKEYAGLGAGVLLGGTGMYLMYKLQMHNADIMERLIGQSMVRLADAIDSLEKAVTKLCEQ